jgi:hypothetical protein
MNQVIKKFYDSARWNTFESICYKAILTIHQTCLFYFATKLIYGLSSFIFAIIYLITELINLGLDKSIAQFSQNYFHNKNFFKRYFVTQMAIQATILLFFGMLALKYHLLDLLLRPAKQPCLANMQIYLIIVIVICESIRKTLRLISQLLFLNKPAALLELSLISIYTGLFWMSAWLGQQINLYTIYIPLLIQSLIGITGLLILISPQIKKNLASHPTSEHSDISYAKIYYYRLQNYLYQLSEMLFTSNFLIYFFTTIIGVINIGQVKLANYFAVFIKALLEKSFGLVSLAIFAKNKHLISTQKVLFNFVQSQLNLILSFLITIFSLLSLIAGYANNNNYLALLFLVFTLVNNFFIVYEQLYLIYNRISVLFLLNLACLASFIVVYLMFPDLFAANQAAYLLMILASLRIISLIITRSLTKSIF